MWKQIISFEVWSGIKFINTRGLNVAKIAIVWNIRAYRNEWRKNEAFMLRVGRSSNVDNENRSGRPNIQTDDLAECVDVKTIEANPFSVENYGN